MAQDEVNQAACKRVTLCSVGTGVTTAATPVSNVVCGPCDGVTEFQNVSALVPCRAVRLCARGDVETRAPTAASDRVCSRPSLSCHVGLFQHSSKSIRSLLHSDFIDSESWIWNLTDF